MEKESIREKTTELANRYQKAESTKEKNDIANELINNIKGLVMSQVGTKCTYPELREECYLDALNTIFSRTLVAWDPKKAADAGCSFATYATYWISTSIRETLRFHTSGPVPIPRKSSGLSEKNSYISFTKLEESNHTNNGPHTGQKCNDLCYKRGLYIAGNQDDAIHDKAAIKNLRAQMKNVLSQREEYVVEECVGSGRTLLDVGNEFGVTRERVRQIRNNAIGKIKKKVVHR
jgi:RNA polymerase sigma factor (sigma-70 family)